MMVSDILTIIIPLLLSPFFIGLIQKTKAFFAGRKGQSVFQLYYDLLKLFKKDLLYSKTTSWIFRLNPIIGLSSMLVILTILPLPGLKAIFSFQGDFLLLLYLLGLIRFFTVIAALDTGSSFEGMGASREVLFSALVEPALFFIFSSMIVMSKNYSLPAMFIGINPFVWKNFTPEIIMLFIAFFILILVENSRIPFDDPNTHLELTMIHEVMVLDYGSFDLGLILYTSAIKFWVFGILLLGMVLPHHNGNVIITALASVGGMSLLALFIGVIESIMARLRLLKAPLLVAGTSILTAIVFILLLLR